MDHTPSSTEALSYPSFCATHHLPLLSLATQTLSWFPQRLPHLPQHLLSYNCPLSSSGISPLPGELLQILSSLFENSCMVAWEISTQHFCQGDFVKSEGVGPLPVPHSVFFISTPKLDHRKPRKASHRPDGQPQFSSLWAFSVQAAPLVLSVLGPSGHTQFLTSLTLCHFPFCHGYAFSKIPLALCSSPRQWPRTWLCPPQDCACTPSLDGGALLKLLENFRRWT